MNKVWQRNITNSHSRPIRLGFVPKRQVFDPKHTAFAQRDIASIATISYYINQVT